MARPPTLEEIYDVAHRAVSIFNSNEYECCLFGSAGCVLYGTTRCPNDVDLVVFADNVDAEDLKTLLVEEDEDFYLVSSRNRRATYEVLWCSLTPGRRGTARACKVDILLPGCLNIPDVPSAQIKKMQHLPVMPLLPLLLLKLQGWTDHRDSDRRDMQEKQYVDVQDIDELLEITCDRRTYIGSRSLQWVPEDFIDDARERVLEYVEEFPASMLYWEALGFQTA